jgi:carboxymethylenebutenolidase
MHTQDVELGFLATPDRGPCPGVVLIHDVWGLTDHARDLAQRLSGERFAVLALDLYRHLDELKIDNPGAWMRGLSDPQILGDVQTGVDFLAANPMVGGHRVGVLGFCMGGMYALMAAATCTGLAASVPFYGLLSHQHGILHSETGLDRALKPKEPLAVARDLRCPTLAFYGDRDEFVPLSDIEQLKDQFALSVHSAEVVIFPGAGHAFMNDTRPDAYRPDAAANAWRQMVAFLTEQLNR